MSWSRAFCVAGHPREVALLGKGGVLVVCVVEGEINLVLCVPC